MGKGCRGTKRSDTEDGQGKGGRKKDVAKQEGDTRKSGKENEKGKARDINEKALLGVKGRKREEN